MPPFVALLLWLVLLLSLLCFEPARDRSASTVLWVPLIWMFIAGSRNPSQWLGGSATLEDGNPVDRTISSALLLLAIGILMSRSFNWSGFFARNLALTVFLLFTLLSILWSDFPLVSLKRWIRDFGNYLVILVVLSDRRPVEATRTLFRRLFFLLIPLSILLVKYYPEIGRVYDPWTGMAQYSGATTGKNLLGLEALLSGLFFFWDTVTIWSHRRQRRTKRVIQVNFAFLGMSLWLLNIANSATCRVCMVLGCLVVAAVHTRFFKRRPLLLKVLIPTAFCLYLILAFGLDMNGQLAGAVGKDPTLTDRTKIWAFVLSMHTNPLIGTGYESFWMGPRLKWFWQTAGLGQINEAHNGYLEVYLNLGLVGLCLLGWFLIASYRTICTRLKPFSNLASLTLALWLTMLFYSVTEAGFRSGLIWLTFLLAGVAVPKRTPDKVRKLARIEGAQAKEKFPLVGLDVTNQWR
jgi:exopolysaccharide production protein ExoQ